MDKDKGVIPWSNEKWTCGIEMTCLLTNLDPNQFGRGEERGEDQPRKGEKGREGL